MTDISSTLNSLTASQLDSVPTLLPRTAPAAHGPLIATSKEEEEPYTIKCICTFQDDDGNTVLCEKCETWQHIECYYPARNVPDIHNCADCEPRPLDTKRATERQKRLREQPDVGERKPKRPPSKSHKKKAKDPNNPPPQSNGWAPPDKPDTARGSENKSGSPRDQPPPAKRPKTSHRASSSISSHAGPKSPAPGQTPRNRSTSNPNVSGPPQRSPTAERPAQTPPHGTYTREFMSLHAHDHGDSPLEANFFSNLKISDTLSSWVRDPEALSQATQGHTPGKVFERVDCSFESLHVPEIVKKVKRDESLECFGEHPTWQYLIVESFVPADGLVGEIKGEIGHNVDYFEEPSNRWAYLRHPEPFVFFHPHLPLYIDTRREGTRCRYVRRSCRPNVTMRTIISNGTECHFCLRAVTNLTPGTEIVVGWYYEPGILDLLTRSLNHDDLSPSEREEICTWIEQVLANFGGCACESPKDCILVQILRQQNAPRGDSTARQPNGVKPDKTRRGKQQTSTPNPSAALRDRRAGSEALHPREQADYNDDSRSTSGSVRSRPRSRDMTPMTHLSNDASMTTTEPEVSDREKRKIAALEKKFEQLEQDGETHGHKKKKRNSGGSCLATPLATTSKQLEFPSPFTSQPPTPHITSKPPNYADVGTSSRKSNSPSSEMRPTSPHNLSSPTKVSRAHQPSNPSRSLHPVDRSNYADSITQTETTDEAWYQKSTLASAKKTFIPLSQRLLKRFTADKIRLQESKTSKSGDMMGSPPIDVTVPGPPTPHSLPDASKSSSPSSPSNDASQVIHDSEERVKESSSPTIHPVDPPPQKHRPPEPAASPTSEDNPEGSVSDRIKPPPLPLETRRPINGFRAAELRVQLPPALHSSGSNLNPSSSSTTSVSSSSPMVYSPLGSYHHPPSFSPSIINNVVQQSPVKKKLSLSEYTRSRGSKVETPSSEKPPGLGSPNPSHIMLKPSSSLAEEVSVPGALEGSAITDSPAKEGSDPLSSSKDPSMAP
ncbi:MAG: hypothetical protein M1837_001659 [Sclerophora amabilis]|nr:MAG: hypothetical protein M1837_001659 [Sclerophora amabilis]